MPTRGSGRRAYAVRYIEAQASAQLPAGPIVPEVVRAGASWTIELRGSPPRPNALMRGSFSRDPEQMLRIRAMRLAMQGKQRSWLDRMGWALVAQNVPKGLARVKVSAIFYRATLDKADEDGDMGALKWAYDAIVRYGVVPDDTRRYMVREVPEERKRAPGAGTNSVEITIVELPPRDSIPAES